MRNYKKEYENYHSRPEQKIRRAARNAARRLFADADPDKDVHHKDNNPLNNDKNNLSLVTQHYNRREPRLRLRGEESALVLPTGRAVDSHIISKFQEILRKAGFAKKQKLAKEFGIKLTQRGKKYQVEDAVSRARELSALKDKHAAEIEKEREDREKEREAAAKEREAGRNEDIEEGTDGAAMIDLMQKYLLSKNPKEKKNLLKQINKYQKKLGLGVTEDIDEISVDKATGRKKAGTWGRTTGGYGAKAAKISKRAGSKGARRVAKRKLRGEGLSDPAQLGKEIEWGASSKNVDSQALSTKQKKQMKDVAKYMGSLKGPNWVSKFTQLYVTSDKLVQQRLKSAAKRGGMSPELMKKLFKEELATVTGPHIAGTGDDSDTVVVKKKKKVYKREALKDFVKKWSTER